MEGWQLQQLQTLPLEVKIRKTKQRIIDWYEHWNGNVYISFSGGKDSTVLFELVRELYPEVPAVFFDTGLEFPEIRDFVKSKDNVIVRYPKKLNPKTNKYQRVTFKEVIAEYGWVFPSKEVARIIYYAKRGSVWAINKLKGLNPDGTYSKFKQRYKKFAYLIDTPEDIIISPFCCKVMKEDPARIFEKETGLMPLTGMMAAESQLRKNAWLENGCNAFDSYRPISSPLAFWKEQDILECLKVKKYDYCSIYGDIVPKGGQEGLFKEIKLKTTGEQRTGCMFCPVGCHLDKENRFKRMKITHPKQYEYCMKPQEKGGLGLVKLLDFANVDY